jgi:hypothetical protein
MSPARETDHAAEDAQAHWATLLPVFVAVVATAVLIVGL